VRFTIDASVHLNALAPAEEGSSASQEFLARVHRVSPDAETSRQEGASPPNEVFSPTLLLVEVAAAVARVFDDTERGTQLAAAVRDLPAQSLLTLDRSLADEASAVAAERRLRGADAVYAAIARRSESLLVTRDRQQLERLPPAIPACPPEQALQILDEASD
jgi:predicted nucleic acid-binding protein